MQKLLLLCVTILFFGQHAYGETKAHATLIAETKSIKPGEPTWLGLHLSLESGWHVYWKNPGDTGKPPKIEWAAAPEISLRGFQWPAPKQFLVGELVNYGYDGDVLLPFQVEIPKNFRGGTARIAGRASWLVCKEECIPESQAIELSLPVSDAIPAPDTNYDKAFDTVKSAIPRELPRGEVEVSFDGGYSIRISRNTFSGKGIESLTYFPDEQDWINASRPQRLASDEDEYVLQVAALDDFPAPEYLSGVLVAAKKNGTSLAVSFRESVTRESSQDGLLLSLFFAFLGGLILNLMPCVFPVLSIKIMAIANSPKEDPSHIRSHSYFYALGIMISFWTIAGLLLLLQGIGREVGWGFQLQQPVFVAFLAILFFLMSLNLLSILEVGGRWIGIGQQLTNREGKLGAFFTGVLAVVVATPCSAPFMGTAISVALLKPGAATILIFSFLGLGLAAPYLLLSYFPRVIGVLPRPGIWMERLKQILAVPLLGTVVWLVWILSVQVPFVLMGSLLFIFISILLAMFFVIGKRPSKFQTVLLAIFLLFSAVAGIRSGSRGSSVSTPTLNWEVFTEKAMAEARQRGQPVFIEFTADWCITCKVNESLVLNSEAFRSLVKENKIALFRADWTNEDPNITRVIRKFQRIGVPLYVVYPVGGEAYVLPQIITVDLIKNALFR